MSTKPYAAIDARVIKGKNSTPVKTGKLLVVVDYQVDFVDGCFGTNPLAVGIETAVAAKIAEAAERGDRIVFTMDTHPADTYSASRESRLFPMHCDPATEGWKLYGKVGEYFGKYDYIEKCVFGSALLMDYIKDHPEITEIELIGVSTSICVFNNGILCLNMFPGCEVAVDYTCCAADSVENHDKALKMLQANGCTINNAPEGF